MGLPAMNIKFVARAQNSAKRLDRGSVGMVLKDAKVPSGNPVTIFSSEDIPEELGTDNKNQIALALRGNDKAPQKVVVYVLATAETDYSKAFKYFERKKVDWMCFPSAKKDSQTQKITDWVKAQREAHNRVKAVLPETEADTEGIVNYARVYPHDESVRMARSENKGTVITIAKLADSIIVREEADIDRIAERIVQKVKETNDNLPQTAVA